MTSSDERTSTANVKTCAEDGDALDIEGLATQNTLSVAHVVELHYHCVYTLADIGRNATLVVLRCREYHKVLLRPVTA